MIKFVIMTQNVIDYFFILIILEAESSKSLETCFMYSKIQNIDLFQSRVFFYF